MSERKIAVVTGGSRGIGRAIAVELAQTGYHVVFTYKSNDQAAEETLALMKEAGSEGEALKFDVTASADAEQHMTALASRVKNIDVLINNAGITADGLFMMMPEQDWDSVISTTLKGFYNMTKPAIRKMARNKSGAVVSISSVAALIPNRGQVNYSAAKSGLIAASRSLAAEVGRMGIRVNVVAPGAIETEMTQHMPLERIKDIIPMARIGRPEEVAKVVSFLCSESASYITGQVISVNGGMF